MAQTSITIEAGSGGQVGEMVQAGVVTGGVGNQRLVGQQKEAVKTDLSGFNIQIKGPSGAQKVGTLTQAGVIEDGIKNTYAATNQQTLSGDNMQDDAMSIESVTVDNTDGLL